MTDSKPAPTPAPAAPPAPESRKQEEVEASAKRAGFANAELQQAAQKKAATPRARKPKAAKPVDTAAAIAKLKEGATGNIEAAIAKGDELTVALGSERGPNKAIEPVAAPLEPSTGRRAGKVQVARAIAHNTHTLPRTTIFTHIWLMNGARPIDVNELGGPVGLSPGQQLEFRRGQLVFG